MAEARQSLETLLAGLGDASRFESVGQLSTVFPGLDVKGLGPIGIPIAPSDAKRIIEKASQAPYGLGDATIVDTGVRRVWQLEPSQFSLHNPTWTESLDGVVAAVKSDFSIRGTVTAELYKLLVYEKGSFFKPHRDTEKIPGMFATLVICLPSRHEGGTLILEHDGQTKHVDFGGADSELQARYVAFYADCRHEVAPIKSGYRICLVYNLARAGKKQPEAPQNAKVIADAAMLIEELFSAPAPLKKVAIPLDHQYTEAGFDPKQLKGKDRTRADVLIQAAQLLDYQCYFALLLLHQNGIPDYETVDFGGSRGNWYDDDYDELDEFDDESVSHDSEGEFEEVFDEELTLVNWRDPDGREEPFVTIDFDDNEVLGLDDKKGWKFKQEILEATGNEGASMDRWYRQGAIAIWPRKRHFEVLATAGPRSAIPALEKLLVESKSAKDLAHCGKVAGLIIKHWRSSDPYGRVMGCYSRPMLRVLERIGDTKLAMRFLREVFPDDFDGSEGIALHGLCQTIGWKTLAPALRKFLAKQKPSNYRANLNQLVAFCKHLCCDPPELTKERRAACVSIVAVLMKAIELWDKVPPMRPFVTSFEEFDEEFDEEDDEEFEESSIAKPASDEELEATKLKALGNDRVGMVPEMLHLLSAIGSDDLLTVFVANLIARPEHYDLRSVLTISVKYLMADKELSAAGRRAANQLARHCIGELRKATAKTPEPPADWKREANFYCSCKDCSALRKFLLNPAERVARFSVKQQRRRHLHEQIDRNGCDVTHVTERKGSPQTLVCTKTQASYERALAQFRADQDMLAELEFHTAVKSVPRRRGRK